MPRGRRPDRLTRRIDRIPLIYLGIASTASSADGFAAIGAVLNRGGGYDDHLSHCGRSRVSSGLLRIKQVLVVISRL